MSRLAITSELLKQLQTELLESSQESCAILYGRSVVKNGRLMRLVVRDVQRITPADYQERSEVTASLRPEVVSVAAQRARKSGESIVFVHTHPFALNSFSSIDDAGEQLIAEFLARRTPGVVHAALLITPEAIIARVLGSKESLEVVGVGSTLTWGKEAKITKHQQAFDRQLRVFGEIGQSRLRDIRVGIVGLGGTGSVVLEQLAHLGVGKLLLIDPDVVEGSNLNRLVGASEADVGKFKVDVAITHAKRINPRIQIEARSSSVLLASVAEELADTDIAFGCTDSQGSRAVLNQFAYQYLVPIIDMGAAIVTHAGCISHIVGRTQLLAPSLGCLLCGEMLDPEAVRVDLLNDFERRADPYVIGIHEPAPAVISLNATVASMAVTMFLGVVTGVPSQARLVNYNGITGASRPSVISQYPTCIACSFRGALARANEWPLPARLS